MTAHPPLNSLQPPPIAERTRSKLVMVGNGMAGVRALEELLKLAPDKYDITVFGSEPHPNYNRILLSPVLAGEMTLKEIILNDVDWYKDNGIKLNTSSRVTRIDRISRQVFSEDGRVEKYDRLLLATGSTPFILPVPGHDLPGVLSYRDIADTDAMIEAASRYHHAVVIGGGLLGLEAANGLRQRGMTVTVVHVMPWLMERQLDRPAAELLKKSLEDRGLQFKLGCETSELMRGEDGRVCALRFKDGSTLATELVVMSVGIRPNTALAESAGLFCHRGIVVSDTLQTFDPRIYAVGECVSHRGIAYGLVAPLFEQAKVAANHLAEYGIARYKGSVTSTKLKVTGIDLFSAGQFMGANDSEDIVLSDPAAGVYKKLVLKGDQLVGAVLYGDTADSAWYMQLLKDAQKVTELRPHLLFGQHHLGDSGHKGETQAASLPDQAEICGCNGVCKGTIIKTIKEKGLFTLEEVRRHTKASSSCGSCTGLVEQLLASTVGGAYQPAEGLHKTLCGCTDHTHEEVRKAIREEHLLTIPQVMTFLVWKTPNGCATCRPALNYYLISSWPHEARDDPQSRFINERAHANIQKDGSFSVVPRLWGGLTTPTELRAIANAAEKYAVPTLKITGGQRIDLLGVKKQDLPHIWADLADSGLVSGHAYGKSLRTVKTCVGSEHCRFGTQRSMVLGVRLEKMLFGMWSPHKVKLAVSGCPRNCAESGIKDVGIIGVDSGYEIYVAGNGGIKTVVAQFLCKVASDDEVTEVVGAFLQLYREQARYLDRTVHWVERIGLDFVKKHVVEDLEQRRTLHERLLFALQGTGDPWMEIAANPSRLQEFEVMSL
ncbi:nitrite reductase large subunit NirB [Ferrovum myxofaciens]|uniref:NAD(P)/FAD-dependent oxidoreductase n=1 Tax=Ferrovum myxofaciens TaxID=416213 RepID=A0A9E6MU87_9PROT|nr:nitrite reductase large subunit NirB [Ferrovum myxofaciens]QKE38307.1 MAG: NAD(P)/FAD-dependent oxidoreductase [Ferrovum myxofaciens]QWY76043.1 MAG: NAD(P)/FAD-dependent oxidoreductase [Ferrovum myxofaciens]QWY76240.1 MAG: NAD(P)/FAD-dependent oxidoreductase [Ferrovum myxofaciens]